MVEQIQYQRVRVTFEHLIFFYCLLALINCLKLLIIFFDLNLPSFFLWYINDITYVFRVMLPFLPLIFGISIDVKIRDRRLLHHTNRALFMSLLLLNYITVLMDYTRQNDDYEFDNKVFIPKVIVIFACLIISKYLIKHQSTKEEQNEQ